MAKSEWTDPPTVVPMTGTEPFIGIEGTVTDFWRFAMSDFRTNILRGYIAEFIVARAVGSDQNRVEWDAYDVITPDKITIEVKSSAYIQAWAQRKPSPISFSGLRGAKWSPQTSYAAEKTYNADVYVFCVHAATDHETYNPLDVSQWDFYVLSNATLSALGQKSISLSRVRALSTGVVPFAELEAAVRSEAGWRPSPTT